MAALALLIAVTIADLLSSHVVFAALVVLAPLLASVRLPPRVVAAVGVAALALVALSSTWNPTASGQAFVRITLVLGGSVLAVLISVIRTRLERERVLERMLTDLIGSTARSPQVLVRDIAEALVPGFADGARVELRPSDDQRHWVGQAGCPVPDDPVAGAAPARATIVRSGDGGWTLTGPLRVGERSAGWLQLHRTGRRFRPGDRTLFDRTADRVALALENSMLLEDSRALASRLEDAHRRLQAVIEQMPAAVSIRDRDGVPTLRNSRAQEIQMASAGDADAEAWYAEHPGRDASGTPIAPGDWPFQRSLRTGEIVRGEEFQFERRDGTWTAVRVNSAPIRDEQDRITSVVSIFDDVTEQHRDRRALRWLAETGRLLDRPHTAEARVEEILRMLANEVADAGLFYTCHPDGSITSSVAVVGREDLRAAVEALGERERRALALDHPAATSVRTQQTLVLARAGAVPAPHAAWLEASGFATALFVPITHAQHVHGCIVLAAQGPRVYDQRDIDVIQLVARRVALALENSRLYAEQHRVATALQRDLLPQTLPEWPGFDLATLYRPARGAADVGGDFFDLFEARDECMLVIGDVSGKGVEAAATTALIRHAVRVAARTAVEGRRLTTVNQAILEDAPGEQFCTMAWAALRRAEGVVSGDVACAGHPPPFVVRADGEVEAVAASGTLLGLFPDIGSQSARLRLEPGDAIVLYTDGVTEARLPDGSLFGPEGLSAALATLGGAPADEILEGIEEALARERAEARDDVAIVVAAVLA